MIDSNLKIWFDSWEKYLLNLSFAKTNDVGEIKISNKQFSRIINLDEIYLSLDRIEGHRRGRPSSWSFNPKFSECEKPVSKSSVTMTFIGDSNNVGEALSPHLKVSTKAREEER